MDRLDIIETLKQLPRKLEAELEGLPASVLRFRPSETEWSIIEVIGHLADASEAWHKRLYQVATLTDPLFTSFDGEAMVKDLGYQDAEPDALVRRIGEQRLKTVDLLSNTVDWTRLGQQRGVGRRSFKQFAEFLISHDEDHLNQIRALKAAAAHA